MTATGHLLRFLATAIVLIVVSLMPVSARAHAGHIHGHAHIHGLSSHGLLHHDPAASPSSHLGAPAVQVVAAAELRAAAQDVQDAAVNCGACVAGCCGNGTGCCGAALAAAPPASVPPVARSLGRDPDALSPGRGREPDGLRRPPRPFA